MDDKGVLEELPCEHEQFESVPFSPVAPAKGRLLAEESRSICPGECEGGEVWELPETTETVVGKTTISGVEVEEFASKPRLLYKHEPAQTLIAKFGAEGVVGPLMSYVADGPGAGKIYLTSELLEASFNAGVLTLSYSEPAGKEPEASELGWTAGAHEAGGGAEGCLIPTPGGQAFLLGGFKQTGAGGREGVVAFDTYTPVHETLHIEALQFGPGGNAKGCPQATVSAPSVTVGGVKVTPLPEEEVTLTSNVTGANVKRVEWKFKNLDSEKEEAPVVVETYEYQTATLKHAFAEEGDYEVTEVVETDNLAHAAVTRTSEVLVKPGQPTFQIVGPEKVRNGSEAQFEANVEDGNKNTTPYKYVWKFGDGSETPGETTGSGSDIVAKHTYHALCASCAVTLEVTDKEGKKGTKTVAVTVVMSQAEEEAAAKRKAEEEAAAKRKAEEEAAAKRKAEEEAAAAKKAEEEATRKKAEEEAAKAKANPEAKLAGTVVSIAANGSFKVKVSCPSGESACQGTIVLKTLTAVSASHRKKAILTLASGSFSVAGGQVKVVALRLSGRARALMAHIHVLRAKATLVAHDSTGASRTIVAVATLRLAKPARRGKH